MNGGEFFRFILGCWHSLTTLSINFHVLSNVRLSVGATGRGTTLPELESEGNIATWSFEKIEEMDLGWSFRPAAAISLESLPKTFPKYLGSLIAGRNNGKTERKTPDLGTTEGTGKIQKSRSDDTQLPPRGANLAFSPPNYTFQRAINPV